MVTNVQIGVGCEVDGGNGGYEAESAGLKVDVGD